MREPGAMRAHMARDLQRIGLAVRWQMAECAAAHGFCSAVRIVLTRAIREAWSITE